MTEPNIDMVDINRKVQSFFYPSKTTPETNLLWTTNNLTQPETSVIEEPMYENTQNFELITQELNDLRELNTKHTVMNAPLSPIYERPLLINPQPPQPILSRSSSLASAISRSVSAAVSQESVTGDSGVFEASRATLLNKDTAQVQIGLKYSMTHCCLVVTIERARNLNALYLPNPENQLCIKVSLVPSIPEQTSKTNTFTDLKKTTFNCCFTFKVSLKKMYAKSLQVKIMSITNDFEEWVGNAQISLAEFNNEDLCSQWYNIISMINPDAIGGTFKEESSDESTVISSQTSTLTRDPNQNLEQQIETLNIDSDEDEQDEDESELTLNQLQLCDNTMYAVYAESQMNNNAPGIDKETNTECAFLPEKKKTKQLNSTKIESTEERIVKRSQTFSPSAVVPKIRYVCRLNRSDSDSAMHFNNQLTPHSFKRGAIERRSLRYNSNNKRISRLLTSGPPAKSYPAIPRTSLDLELDLKAQQTKLSNLNEEIAKLRQLKHNLEQARDNHDTKIANWAIENEQLQKIVDQINPETKHMQKLMHKTSKEIYKLRKTKACKGQPDVTSFMEKMVFFTRQGLTVPEIPIDSKIFSEELSIEAYKNNTHNAPL
uniref:CSON001615 protein n=1 Tax=Culicoides sonorensis TaxID=179676 RepID=A0A336MHJ1_CULSO